MNKLKTILAIFIASVCVLGAAAQTVADVNKKYTEAAALLKAGKTAEAIPVFEKALQMGMTVGEESMATVTAIQTTLPKCYFSIGMAAAKATNYDSALASFAKAAESAELYGDMTTMRRAKGVMSQVYSKMATEAFNKKDYLKAIEIYGKGYKANARDTDVALKLAMSYCEMGNYPKGYEVYNAVVELGTTHSKYVTDAKEAADKIGYYRLIEVNKFLTAKDYAGFYSKVDEILVADAKNAAAPFLATQVAMNAKNYDKVIQYGVVAIANQTTPDLISDANFFVGGAYQNKENKVKAIELYKKVTSGKNVAIAKEQIVLLSK